MKHSTYNWKNKKGQNIFAQSWEVEQPDAVICIVHGQSDYSDRYAHVAAWMNEKNISAFAIDLIGHGKSDGKRGHVFRFYEYIELAELMFDEVRNRYPSTPVFMYGHSMGGNICLNQALITTRNIDGFIISAPWLRLAFEPPKWKVAVGKTIKTILPGLSQPTGLNVQYISRDPAVVERYINDPMVHGKITPSGYFEIDTYGKHILLNAKHLNFPMLLMHGTADGIIDHTASREVAAMRPDLISYIEFNGLYHEIHNEPEREVVFDAVYKWIHIMIEKKAT